MTDHRLELGSEHQPSSEELPSDPRLLELQLIRIRRHAAAARLEARAAEIELLLRRLSMTEARSPEAAETSTDVESHVSPIRSSVDDPPGADRPETSVNLAAGKLGWPTDRDAPGDRRRISMSGDEPALLRGEPTSKESEPLPSRSRPGAFFLSAGLHLGLLVLLALISLHTPPPLDQVALTASPAQPDPEPIESVTIETSEPQAEPVQPQQTEADVALDPTEALQPIALESLDSLDPLLRSLASSESSSSNAQTLSDSSPAAERITFCGVEGGGNHFVYLVDCSKSMGIAFESARNELLRSIDALRPDQRFYVIFFDAEPDYMRVNPRDADNTQSVLATPKHKLALKQWAMGIKMDRGQAPYEPLEFALELQPDVIFLLSDGEFPAGIESLLQERNRVENLFGENRIRSIVHTIGYHSRTGEVRMRAIAQQNQGQYRHVPKP